MILFFLQSLETHVGTTKAPVHRFWGTLAHPTQLTSPIRDLQLYPLGHVTAVLQRSHWQHGCTECAGRRASLFKWARTRSGPLLWAPSSRYIEHAAHGVGSCSSPMQVLTSKTSVCWYQTCQFEHPMLTRRSGPDFFLSVCSSDTGACILRTRVQHPTYRNTKERTCSTSTRPNLRFFFSCHFLSLSSIFLFQT